LIFKRLLIVIIALAAAAVATGVCVVAAAFAVYALAREVLGPAGGAAVVAGVFALLTVILAVVMTRKAAPSEKARDETFVERLLGMARDRPVVSAAVVAAATALLARNPRILSAVLSAVIVSQSAKSDR
jgi:uncharacterized membrane protein